MSRIISRAEWGARYRDGFRDAPVPAENVWLHHSVTVAPDLHQPFTDDYEAIRTLERIGQQRFGGGISYTFAVTPVGLIFEGHSIGRQGAHTRGRNTLDRAIVLVGDYSRRAPTEAQVDAIAWLLRTGKDEGWFRAAEIAGGHRDAPEASTSCPGNKGHAAIASINFRAAAGGNEDEMTDADRQLLQQAAADAALARSNSEAALRLVREVRDGRLGNRNYVGDARKQRLALRLLLDDAGIETVHPLDDAGKAV